jgi:hypothetical protein
MREWVCISLLAFIQDRLIIAQMNASLWELQ